jgi:alpha-mannosidase
VDWQEEQTLLKLHFPTEYRGAMARFGAPFGSILRGQQPGSPVREAQWEVPGSRWAAVCNDGEREGLAIITEAKYGFGVRDGDLSVSLLRSARSTGADEHRYLLPRGLSRHQPASPFTDQGRHVIRLALAGGDFAAAAHGHPAALADSLFTQPVVYRGAEVGAGILGLTDAPTLVPAWAMPLTARSWVLRLHEVAGQQGRAGLQLAPGWRARLCGLDGREGLRGSAARINYRPYQIVSVRLERD